MPGRIIAVGDIHGCADAFRSLIEAIGPLPEDTLVLLGDLIDRGPDSRGVLDLAIGLRQRCELVSIRGNHEQMFLAYLDLGVDEMGWLIYGGRETLDSYGDGADIHNIPPSHIEFLNESLPYYETESHIFTHASYHPELPLAEQQTYTLRWESLRNCYPQPHFSGKTAIVGHTPQRSGEILDLGHLKCIDTRCYGGGWLTALDVTTGATWQADRDGRMRSDRPAGD